ncbi:MAG TPA: helix-turn-helix domain-containing protein [Ferruginibacter sp.]|jgi:hypothetical protein|nr:helix-turn-helix domain-containing protein [Ferruginibacter sp.]
MDINSIATKGDIEILKNELSEIKSLLRNQPTQRNILRSADVRKLLNISDGTLQRLRISGELPGRKINGTWFYNSKDVSNLI